MIRLFLLIAPFLCSSCILRRYSITELESPSPYGAKGEEDLWRFHFDRDVQRPLRASLSETMFVVCRYRLGDELVSLLPPPGRREFPPASTWSKTHAFKDMSVFTSPLYYRGQLGLVADDEAKYGSRPILLQVGGGKRGSWWRLKQRVESRSIFYRPWIDTETWAIRYGGSRDGLTYLQIIDRPDASVSQVQQELTIPDEQLADGVLIKGLILTILETKPEGAVSYSLSSNGAPVSFGEMWRPWN